MTQWHNDPISQRVMGLILTKQSLFRYRNSWKYWESTGSAYTHQCKGKTKMNIPYPRCKFNIYYMLHSLRLSVFDIQHEIQGSLKKCLKKWYKWPLCMFLYFTDQTYFRWKVGLNMAACGFQTSLSVSVTRPRPMKRWPNWHPRLL